MFRRGFLAFLASLFLHPALATEPPVRLDENAVDVAYENEMFVGRFSFLVPVPADIAWGVLTDFERMADFVPNLEASRTLKREGQIFHVAQRGKMNFGPFTFRFDSERRVEAREREGRLLSRAVAGSARHMQSEMRVQPEGGGTRLDYRIEMIPDRWIPSGMGVGFMRHELAEQFSAMAREMLRRQQRRSG